jgi:hypothetical protein
MVTPAPVSLAKQIAIHSHVPPLCPFQQPAWEMSWDDNFSNKALNTPLLPAPTPLGASTDKVKLNDALDNNTVASITSTQALLLPPTDLITLSNGSPATFFATINQHLKELACQHDTIAKKHDKMHTLINTVRDLVDVHAIKRTVQSAVADLQQWVTVTVDSGVSVTLANPNFFQRLDLVVAATLATPAFLDNWMP